MNWKSLLIGTIAGFAGGYLVKELSTSSSYVSSEAVLEKVKKHSGKKDRLMVRGFIWSQKTM
ncbi:hypothetical protein [Bacillus coahuilensis]|uniref:hypothetical protein n=1 Tax=Bacillus coahuilensis TaxID=408580 RepID=UPI00018510F5|nr:hypothetical protein [Bacillus coahuilensis]